MAKSLFIFTFLLFFWDLLHRKKCGKVSCYRYHRYHSHMVTSYDKSYDECGKVVHRPCSNCISSVQKVTGTPLSSPCQLRLGGWLSCLG